MTDTSKYYLWVDKSTGTFADQLLAFGLAETAYRAVGGDVIIEDVGPALRLTLERPLDQATDEGIAQMGLLRFIETDKAPSPPGVNHINYANERRIESEYFAARAALPKRAARSAPDDSALPPTANPELPIWKLINQMSALSAYNEVVVRWHADRCHWSSYLQLIASIFGSQPNALEAAETEWKVISKANGLNSKSHVTATQIVNPTMGKGGDAPKANNVAPGNKDSFWIVEYLKFLGAYVAAVPMLVRGSKDRKTYVPVPVRMTLSRHKAIISSLRQVLWSNSAVKLDVMAALLYTDTFLQQWKMGNVTEGMIIPTEPGKFVSGLSVAFYKDMGSALALLNLSQIRLPGWMRVETAAGAERYQELLEEHRRLVQSLEEKKSDEYHLLQSYRDFVSGRDLEAFYDFTAGYAPVLMRRLDRGEPAPQLSTENLEVLLMGHDEQQRLKEIIDNPGFQNIATAIRLSTVVPQRQKARKERPLYDIRYGLGDDLKRKAAYPQELAQAIGDFAHSYNQETMQKYERSGQQPRRRLITDDDLMQVITLLTTNDSTTVGSLLIAFGYARSVWHGEGKEGAAETPEPQQELQQMEVLPDTMGEEEDD